MLVQESIQELRPRIDEGLAEYLRPHPECPEGLREAMTYSLLAGGKRLRPILVLLSAEACGGSYQAALPAACAIEMVHTYSLIHDDLPAMDDDPLRRGQPTNHTVYGEAAAILAGDGLLTMAFEVLARDIQPPETAAKCCAELAESAGVRGMVGGQSADLAASHTSPPAEDARETLESIHRMKTARLIEAAVALGAHVAAADDVTLERLRDYGSRVGLAFQIADDLLDVRGDDRRTGKASGRDAELGKLTYPGVVGLDQSERRAAELVETACQAIAPLGSAASRLVALARFVLNRDH